MLQLVSALARVVGQLSTGGPRAQLEQWEIDYKRSRKAGTLRKDATDSVITLLITIVLALVLGGIGLVLLGIGLFWLILSVHF